MKTTLLLATNNPGKRWNFQHLLSGLPLRLLTPADLSLVLHVDESGGTYRENASLKAAAFSRATELPALADDSGLEVEVLGGAPGIHSARYAPQPGASDADRCEYLLAQLSGHPRPWRARFCCAIAVALPNGEMFFGWGTCPGEIVPAARGERGFGYDPIFQLPDGRTMAELEDAQKNRLSHRARAVADIRDELLRRLR